MDIIRSMLKFVWVKHDVDKIDKKAERGETGNDKVHGCLQQPMKRSMLIIKMTACRK